MLIQLINVFEKQQKKAKFLTLKPKYDVNNQHFDLKNPQKQNVVL